MTPSCQPLSTDALLELLADSRRRRLVRFLDDADEPVPLERFVAAFAGPEEAETELGLALYHRHLPRLDDAGVVDYDPARGTIERDSNFEAAARLLDWLETHREDVPE